MNGMPTETGELSTLKRALLKLDELEARLAASEGRLREPVAIVGLGCRFPGGADSPEALWRLLRAGRDAVGEIPPGRWDAGAYYDPRPGTPGRMITRWGGFLERVDEFDPQFFGISPREATGMDPQQRLLLEVAWEALEDAALAPDRLAGSRAGVFIGICKSDYMQRLLQGGDPTRYDAYFASGNAHSVASGRLSYLLGLQGPSVSVDTACSSSLVAVHLACQSLRTGESDLALAGGVNVILSPESTIAFSRSSMLAADGRCKTFDARADGFVQGEGAAVIVLKRLADALRDGDPIQAVIRGSAAGQDGASSGLTAPNGPAQEAVIRAALANAGLRPGEVDYVEAHGTGTSLGDPIEVQALAAVLGEGRAADRPVLIGSIKTNIGHLEAAAGIAGLIKVVLALRQGEIPAHLHFSEPNPFIPWAELPVRVAAGHQAWPSRDGARVAAVSGFGFSGTNVHIVLEQAPNVEVRAPELRAQLLCLSATGEQPLRELARRLADYLEAYPEAALADICRTINEGRARHAHRVAIPAATAAELRAKLRAFADNQGGGDWIQGVVDAGEAPQAAFLVMDPALAGLETATPGSRRLSGLPTYPFQRRRYWQTTTAPRAAEPPPADDPAHPLLGRRVGLALQDVVYENVLSARHPAWLGEHVVHGVTVLPLTALLEMNRSVAGAMLGREPARLKDLVIHEALTLGEGAACRVQAIGTPAGEGEGTIRIYSQPETAATAPWRLHAECHLAERDDRAAQSAEEREPLEAMRRRCAEEIDLEAFYDGLWKRGLQCGAAFRGLHRLWRRDGEALGEVRLDGSMVEEAGSYWVHPVQLDACIQTLAAAVAGFAAGDRDAPIYMPVALDAMLLEGRPEFTGSEAAGGLISHAWIESAAALGGETMLAHCELLTPEGRRAGLLRGLRLKRVAPETLRRMAQGAAGRNVEDWLYRVAWRDQPLESAGPAWSPGMPARIAERLLARVAPLADRFGMSDEVEFDRELDRLCTAHLLVALRELGWAMQPGERWTSEALAERLGVAERHHRLFTRLLHILREDGLLARRDGLWVVERAPATGAWDEAPQRIAERIMSNHGDDLAIRPRLVRRCGERLGAVLRGAVDPLELIFPKGNAEDAALLYKATPQARLFNTLLREAVEILLANRPEGRLRVLEVGAGTGGTTSFLLPALPADRTEYVLTDLGASFLVRAERLFSEYPFLRTQTLDIGCDPEAQGFEAGTFDLVIASNVLHATPDLRASLEHVRRLLAPGGALLMIETTAQQRWIDLTFGLTEGWWCFRDHALRPNQPLLDQAQWLALLKAAGFAAEAIPAAGAGAIYGQQTVLVAQAQTGSAPEAASDDARRGTWLILADRGGMGRRLADRFEREGRACQLAYAAAADASEARIVDPAQAETFAELVREAAPLAGVIYLWGLDDAADEESPEALTAAQEHAARGLLFLAQALARSSAARERDFALWVVTRGAQPAGGGIAHPAHATLWGLGRVIALEHPELRCLRRDLDFIDGADALERLSAEFLTAGRTPEDEAAWREGRRLVPRLERLRTGAGPEPADLRPRRLENATPGVLDGLMLRPQARRIPGPGEVEILVRAAGLNFRDVLNALAMRQDSEPLGSECAGVVTAVGAGVTAIRPGDEVIAIAPGCFGDRVTARAELVVPRPDRLTPPEAATIPLAFLTAHFALHAMGRLRAGERVLVHSAAGGVGLAAVTLARRAGAEVLATAGSEEKREYLRRLGVAGVFDSRRPEEAGAIRAATGGRGVDLVLNALSGAWIENGLGLLAPGGRFIEIGKTRILGIAEAAAINPGAQYHALDLAVALREEPASLRPLLLNLVEQAARGELAPLPLRTFALEDAAAAFRHMAAARHIGKVVLVNGTPASITVTDRLRMRGDATYLITGGLGGLGLATARWLAGRGARRLALAGRSAPGEHARALIEELEAQGVRVLTLEADVAQAGAAERLVARVEAELGPLAGVVHAAGVLDDGALLSQSWERFERVLAPKVLGAWALHRATRHRALDFFVLYSSGASLLGSPGQANHAAANAFLDALAHWRRGRGLAALSINWGPWAEVGAAASQGVAERQANQGIEAFSPAEGIRALERLLECGPTQAAVLPVRWPVFLEHYAGGKTPPFLEIFKDESRGGATAKPAGGGGRDGFTAPPDDLLAALAAAVPERRQAMLTARIRELAARVLVLDSQTMTDDRKPLHELGLDSLMAVELRNLLAGSLRVTGGLPATLVFDFPSVAALSDWLGREALGWGAAAEPSPQDVQEDQQDDLLTRLEMLSDDETDQLLAKRLTEGAVHD